MDFDELDAGAEIAARPTLEELKRRALAAIREQLSLYSEVELLPEEERWQFKEWYFKLLTEPPPFGRRKGGVVH